VTMNTVLRVSVNVNFGERRPGVGRMSRTECSRPLPES